jgi:hypothetical protein
MNKTILLLVLCATVLTANAQEQKDVFTIPKTLLKLYPQAFFVNTFQLGIETFNPAYSRSFNLDVGLRTRNENWDSQYAGFYGDIAYRKYFVPMKLTDHITRQYYMGFYYSVGFKGGFYQTQSYEEFNGTYDYVDSELWSFSPYFVLGLQRTFWEVLYIDIFMGGAIGIPVYSDDAYKVSYPDIIEPAFKGIYPKIGVKIGVGF